MFITQAFAQDGAAASSAMGSGLEMLLLFAPLMVVWYFFLIRPQSKRAKEHRELVSALAKGDEVVTSGGILGKVNKVTDDFVVLEVSDSVELKFQKGAIAATLPKGTLKAI